MRSLSLSKSVNVVKAASLQVVSRASTTVKLIALISESCKFINILKVKK